MEEVNAIDWHIAPWRADRWLELWWPAAERMPAFGAKSWSLTRSIDDPLAFRQSSSGRTAPTSSVTGTPERSRRASGVIDLYDKPLLPAWHTLLAAE